MHLNTGRALGDRGHCDALQMAGRCKSLLDRVWAWVGREGGASGRKDGSDLRGISECASEGLVTSGSAF